MPPKAVICYLCGRDFTHASLGIHEPQCLKVKVNSFLQNVKHPFTGQRHYIEHRQYFQCSVR
jgi:hypothetical protein